MATPNNPTKQWTELEGLLRVNEQYQDGIKILINIATATLVLPIAFLKNIIDVPPTEMRANLSPWGYVAWCLLAASVVACGTFYYCSTKFAKAIYTTGNKDSQWEDGRDASGVIAALCFFVGFIILLIFFSERLGEYPSPVAK